MPNRHGRINFTKKALEALSTANDKRIVCYDSQARGLGVLVQVTGHKSFFWSRKVNGNATWKTIGGGIRVRLSRPGDGSYEQRGLRAIMWQWSIVGELASTSESWTGKGKRA